MASRYRSNEDHTRMISKSIFVTNFPDNTTSKDLWKLCQGYGTVVDVYIPNRKSKAGKHFGSDIPGASSFASALKGNFTIPSPVSSMPLMVLDDSCVVVRDLDNYVVGELKQFSSITNLRILPSNGGFQNVNLAYLGGMWVMLELESSITKEKFMKHWGEKGRDVWVEETYRVYHYISWTRTTFNKIGSKWEEVMELEESKEDMFARKRICIKTKQVDNILETFKIIIHEKIFMIRAKELFVWSPVFKEDKEFVYCTDDESVKGVEEEKGTIKNQVNSDAESDVDGVSETYFREHESNLENDQNQEQPLKEKEISDDPFQIYDLLRKQDEGVVTSGLDKSIPYPPGFTPEKDNTKTEAHEVKDKDSAMSQSRSEGLCSRISEDAQPVDEYLSSDGRVNGHEQKKGGSILEVLDDMIKVGQTMGFSMEGCNEHNRVGGRFGVVGLLGSKAKKEWIRELNVKHKAKILVISIYAPQAIIEKRSLWNYITSLITRWDGECIVMGDFNKIKEVSMMIFFSRMDLMKQMQDHKLSDARDNMQKAKIQWAIEGDKNSKFFYGIINRKRVNLSIIGVMVDGEWVDEPNRVKEEFCSHFAMRFQAPVVNRSKLNFQFPKRLNSDQVAELENPITRSRNTLKKREVAVLLNGFFIIVRSQGDVTRLSYLQSRKFKIRSS
ncbi:RNA-directed DNA polymerase, eukaryota [Tanacetum coccineum]